MCVSIGGTLELMPMSMIWIADCDGLIPITKPPQSWCYVEYYGAK